MTYTLEISLVGDDKANTALDNLLKKVATISSGSVPLVDWAKASVTKSAEGAGAKVAKSFTSGFKRYGMADITKMFSQNSCALPDVGKIINKNSKTPLDWKKILLGGALGFSNPYIGSRLISDALGFGKTGGGGSVASGIFGGGGALGFAGIFASFQLLKSSIDKFSESMENARQLYSKALQSGLGLQFTAQRSILANILGVSETDVMRFGAQMAYLNPKLRDAVYVLTKVNPALTTASYQFKVMQQDVQSLSSAISSKFAPAVGDAAEVIGKTQSKLARFITDLRFEGDPGDIHSQRRENVVKWFEGLLGIGGANGALPQPQSFMKQLPSSSLEKMGLVIGGGGNSTNDLIRKSNGYLKKIADAISPQNIPRAGQFGLSPTVSNP